MRRSLLALALITVLLVPSCTLVRDHAFGERALTAIPSSFTVDEQVVHADLGVVAQFDYLNEAKTRYVEVHKDILTGEVRDVFTVSPSTLKAAADVAGLFGFGALAESILAITTIAGGVGGGARVRRTLKDKAASA